MKTFLRNGKKALSVFMAVMMIMTAWVFVAPQKAEAASGTYYVKLTWHVGQTGNFASAYTGWANKDNDQCGISLYYRTNNGKGDLKEVWWDIGAAQTGGGDGTSISNTGYMNGSADTEYYATAVISGFPQGVYIYNDDNRVSLVGGSSTNYITKIEVGASASSSLTTIWEGKIHTNSTNDGKEAYITCDADNSVQVSGSYDDDKYQYATTENDNWVYPYANTFNWSTSPSAVTLPASSTASAVTTSGTVTALDQYGVQMFDPTWSISSSQGTDQMKVTTTGSSSTGTVSLPYAANWMNDSSTNSQASNNNATVANQNRKSVSLTATWAGVSQTKTSSKSFNVTDATYTATFTNLRDADYGLLANSTTSGLYYGIVPTAATTAATADEGDYRYTFKEWSPAISAITANTTYTATYTQEFVEADYTAVNAALADAATYTSASDYEAHYTADSRANLQSAIDAVVTGLGRTHQDTVTGYATAINNAIAALKNTTHTVKFVDKNGVLIYTTRGVEYGSSCAAPAASDLAKEPTSTLHFSNPTISSDEQAKLASVKTDISVTVSYTEAAHTFDKEEVVAANCLHGSSKAHTCSVCGYQDIYESDSNLGKHTKSSDLVVITEPTCTTTGTGRYYCTVCFKSDVGLEFSDGTTNADVTINANGHSYTAKETTAATCTTEGVRTYTCSVCNNQYTEKIPVTQHEYVKNGTEAATCTTVPYTIYKCKNCDATYAEYTTGATANGHSYEVESVSHSAVTLKCSVCGDTLDYTIDNEAGHDYSNVEVTTQPTCSTTGTAVLSCADGDSTTIEITLPTVSTAHNVVGTLVKATCNAPGSYTATCSLCGTTLYTQEIAQVSHSYGYERTEATCTEDGKITKVCQNCGDDQSETIPATGHKTVILPAVEATCTTDGKTAGSKCAVCGEIIDAQTTVSAKGHTWTGTEQTMAATCTKEGYKFIKCANCDAEQVTETIPATGHTYTDTVTAPTCTTKGYTTHKCTVCGITIVDTYTDTVDHSFSDWTTDVAAKCGVQGTEKRTCSVCGKVEYRATDALEHNYVSTVTAPTCTQKGYTTKVCSVCNNTVIDTFTDPTGHSFGDWTTVAATCTAAGSKTRTCTDCGASESVVIEATGHDYVETKHEATCDTPAYSEFVCKNDASHTYKAYASDADFKVKDHAWNSGEITKAATCTEDGEITYTCTSCGDTKTDVISKLGHDFVAGTTVDATCTSGKYTPYTCSRCSESYKDYDSEPLGHDYGAWTVTASTNDTAGSMTRTCSRCSDVETVEIPAGGHTLAVDESQHVDPTCIAEGKDVYVCTAHTNCGVKVEVTLDKVDHKLTTAKTDATCTTAGSIVTTCSVCNAEISKTTIPALGHDYSNKEITKAATCTEEGTITYTCTRCSDKVTETTAKLQHEYEVQSEVAATCTAPGYKVMKCANCSSTYNEMVSDPTGHTYTHSTTTAATCTTDGVETYTCTSGDDSYTVTIPKTGHNYKTTEVIQEKTCAQPEITKYTCDCGESYEAITASATGEHSFGAFVTTVEATTTSEGERTATCSVCGFTTTESIPKITEHSYTELVENVAPTCTEDGYKVYKCVLDHGSGTCGQTTTITVSKLGHKYGKLTVTPATCTEDGKTVVSCTVCNDTLQTETIPANGHQYEVQSVVESTCKTAGSITYKCAACNDVKTEEIPINASRHNLVAGTTTAADCVNDGYTSYTCADCGTTYLYKTADKLGHSFGTEFVVDRAATCAAAGSKSKHCSVCGAKTEVTEIPALSHDTATRTTVEATCTKTGLKETYCKTCNLIISSEVIPVLDHTWVSKEVKATSDTEAGYKYNYCSTCGLIDESSITVTEAIGHDYKQIDYKEATNDANGYYKYECANCGDVKTVVIPAQGHNFVLDTDASTAPTCSAEGTNVYKCSTHTDCGLGYSENVDKLAHTYATTTTDATCTTDGKSTIACSVCGDVAQVVTIPAKGHTLEEDTTQDVAATCIAEGKIVYQCKDCTYSETTTVEKVAHKYDTVGEITTEPTCTANGVRTYKCTQEGCTATKTAVEPMLGHNMVTTDVPATCFTNAYTTYTCSRCGYSYTISHANTRVAHQFSLIDHQDATCENGGFSQYKCDLCGYEYTTETAALGHNWGDWTVVKAATCSDSGLAKRVCKNDSSHVETEEIAATGNHVYVQTVVAPTCTQQGYTINACKQCGVAYRSLFVEPLGHNYTSVHSDATCTEDGGTTYTCTRCTADEDGHSYFVKDADALGHDWSEYTIVAHPTVDGAYAKMATCQRNGCTAVKYETATGSTEDSSDKTINQYFKVQYVNDYVTGKTYTAGDGTVLADEGGYKAEFLQTSYVLKGEAASYEGKTPTRDKTEEYGQYNFTGWTADDDLDLEAVTDNIVAHATFEGVEVTYWVMFYNSTGEVLSGTQYVKHGEAATAPAKTPKQASNIYYNFEFDHWDKDFSAVYSNCSVRAVYNTVPRTYKVVYHDWDGTVLDSEVFQYGSAPTKLPTGLTRTADASCIYEFSGLWRLADGTLYGTDGLTVPSTDYAEYNAKNENNEYLTDAEKGIVHVYADYYSKFKQYKVRLVAVDSDGDKIPGATVQILNSEGYLYSTATLDSSSEVTLTLTYDTQYTLQVTYMGEVASAIITLDERNLNDNYPTVRIILETGEEYYDEGSSCSCICHVPLIGRIYIAFLNIIYRLTGRKTVCCEDMYAKHGSQLVYGK